MVEKTSKYRENLLDILNRNPYIHPINNVARSIDKRISDVTKIISDINKKSEKILSLNLPSKYIKYAKKNGVKIHYGTPLLYELKNENEALTYIAKNIPKNKTDRVRILNSLNYSLNDKTYWKIRRNSLTKLEKDLIDIISEREDATCSDISEILDVPKPSITRAATRLEDLGRVVKRKKNRHRVQGSYIVNLLKESKNS